MKKTTLSFLLLGLLSSCATIPNQAVGLDERLVIEVAGARRFVVDGHLFSEFQLASAIGHLKISHPDLALDIFIPSRLLGANKEESCYQAVGYLVQTSVAVEKQRFFEWQPRIASSVKQITCEFITLA